MLRTLYHKDTSKNPILTQRYKKFAITRRMCEGAMNSVKHIQRSKSEFLVSPFGRYFETQACTSFSIARAMAMTQENTCTILHFKIPLSAYRVIRNALVSI